jgi:hypothetical protein
LNACIVSSVRVKRQLVLAIAREVIVSNLVNCPFSTF